MSPTMMPRHLPARAPRARSPEAHLLQPSPREQRRGARIGPSWEAGRERIGPTWEAGRERIGVRAVRAGGRWRHGRAAATARAEPARTAARGADRSHVGGGAVSDTPDDPDVALPEPIATSASPTPRHARRARARGDVPKRREASWGPIGRYECGVRVRASLTEHVIRPPERAREGASPRARGSRATPCKHPRARSPAWQRRTCERAGDASGDARAGPDYGAGAISEDAEIVAPARSRNSA